MLKLALPTWALVTRGLLGFTFPVASLGLILISRGFVIATGQAALIQVSICAVLAFLLFAWAVRSLTLNTRRLVVHSDE